MKKVLYLIQLPPPVHGVSTINKYVFESEIINNGLKKRLVELKFSNSIYELRSLTVKKIGRTGIIFFQLFYQLIRFNPDIVYFSIMPVGKGFFRDLLYVFVLKIFRKKIIYHIHNRGIRKKISNKLWMFLYKFTFNHSAIIHLSSKLLDTEIIPLNLKNSKTFIIENGVKAMDSLKIDKQAGSFHLLFVSNILTGKGYDILIDAFKELSGDFPNMYLHIIGAARKGGKEEIINFIGARHQNIIYHGELTGRERDFYFSLADIFVFPTYFEQECFPLVVLEAFQAGIPVITTDNGALGEIIDNGINGILVQQKNKDSLVQAVKVLINDEEIRKNIGENGKKMFLAQYTLEHFERRVHKVFKGVLHNH